jgi:putative membrane protein
MRQFLIRFILNLLSLLAVVYIVPGISIAAGRVALVAALVLILINVFLKPVIIILTLPFNIMTLGLLTLFINASLFYLASKIVKGFAIASFGSAFWGALLFSIINILLTWFTKIDNGIRVNTVRYSSSRHKPTRTIIDIEAETKKLP